MQQIEAPPTVHPEIGPYGERISIETTGTGWRRRDTIITVVGTGRKKRVTVTFRYYGPLGRLYGAVFNWLAKNAD